jgi:tRNA pseudouridine38-40 synthase
LGKKYVWWIKDKLDLKKMEAALQLFVGMKNMQSFTDDDPEEKSTKVLVDAIQVKQAGDLILIRIVGSHFVWKLARRIVGVAAEVGRGKLCHEDVQRFLTTKSEEPARHTAPPSGLFLEKIYYKGEKHLEHLHPVFNIT